VSFAESLLQPLTFPYDAWVRARAAAYKAKILRSRRLGAKVISVGNITTGGTGKTPMALWIAERLLREGQKAAILTRGYRGKVATGDATDASVGHTSDEVQLLRARLGDRVAMGIGADRYARGRELVAHGVEWFILDDGFQHLQLERDVDVVLVDALNPFGGGHLLPAGRLREPKSALARADLVVITRRFHAPAVEAAIRRDTNAPLFHARAALKSVRDLRGGYPGAEATNPRDRRYFAFCGIGNAAAFFSDLRNWGFQIAEQRSFPDHHRYTQSEANQLISQARESGATALLCTEKDVFNLAGIEWGDSEVFYARISLEIDREEEFWNAIKQKAESGFAPRRST
jgi:tetraacyldisaccharide 4'-kinase